MASGLGRDLVVFFRTAYKHEYDTAETCVIFFSSSTRTVLSSNPFLETDETGHYGTRSGGGARVSMVLHQSELR